MEATNILDDSFSENLSISEAARNYLAETAKWAKLIAIVGFVFVGLMAILAFFIGSIIGAMTAATPELDQGLGFMSTTFLTIMYLAIALISFIPILYLYRFATKTQMALRANNELVLTDAFKNLKSHYKFYGILMAILIGFYMLAFLFALIGGTAFL